MATNYTSSPLATQVPSPAPGPGVLPIISVPAGTDAPTIESITQQMKVEADFIGHIQSAVRLDTPVIAASGSGFTAPGYSSFGGTITPSGLVKNSSGLRFVVQIQTGGAVGVATFKTSTDGGNTYGGLQTTAASMTDATTGITFAFAGTLTANGTAAFRSGFTPLAQWVDTAGNVRGQVDWNGFPMGKYTLLEEDWDISFNTGTGGVITAAPKWTISSSSGNADTTSIPGVGPGGTGTGVPTGLKLNPGTVNTNKIAVGTTFARADGQFTGLCAVMEWDASLNTSAANLTWFSGLFSSNDPTGGVPGVGLAKRSSDTNWQFIGGNFATIVDTGVAPVLGTAQRFKLALYGSATAYGAATAKLFINEGLVGTITTNLPTTSTLWPTFAGICTGAATGLMSVFPMKLAVGKYLSTPPL